MKPLKQGWFRPQGQIDLHRYTVVEAESALQKFLDKSFLEGKTWVLVIHGAKTLLGVVHRALNAHPLVEDHEPENPGATRVRLANKNKRG